MTNDNFNAATSGAPAVKTGKPGVCELRNARILGPARGIDTIGDLRLAVHSPSISEIDCTGMIVMPSPIDLHAHFREGFQPSAISNQPFFLPLPETVASGSCAAARGGFATVVTMPNTTPPVDTPEAVRWQMNAPRHPFAKLRVLASACCTKGRAGKECADLEALAAAGAVAFTDDGNMVEDDAVMEEVMDRAAALGVVVMQHALSNSHTEPEAIMRDIALCAKTGCRLHIQHVSRAASVELIREARARGLPVTAEATPHHLFFSEDDMPGRSAGTPPHANWKMNPPLATCNDVAALRRGVADGTITCFATDHAPHTAEAKARGFDDAPFGVIGLETALAATWGVCHTPLQWARRWICGPAEVLGIPPPSFPDSPATILSLEEWTVTDSDFASSSRNSPFAGVKLPVKVRRMLG